MAVFSYRQGTSVDIADMVSLLQELFAIEKDFTFDHLLQRMGLQLLLQSDSGMIYLAQTGEEIIGMVTGQLLVSTAEGSYSLLVEDLIVKEEFRGSGVGTELLSWISSWGSTRKATRMQLLADNTNVRALDFYLKNYWQKTQLICLRKYNSGT